MICYIREADESEMGRYIIVVNDIALTVGFCDLGEALRFCTVILGASSFSYTTSNVVNVMRFDKQRKYCLPNNSSIDQLLGY